MCKDCSKVSRFTAILSLSLFLLDLDGNALSPLYVLTILLLLFLFLPHTPPINTFPPLLLALLHCLYTDVVLGDEPAACFFFYFSTHRKFVVNDVTTKSTFFVNWRRRENT